MGVVNREADLMAKVHVTRCPFCNTSFRVNDEQLSVANGSVRCGSCLKVFMAELYFLDGGESKNGQNKDGKNKDGQNKDGQNKDGQNKKSQSKNSQPEKAKAKTKAKNSQTDNKVVDLRARQQAKKQLAKKKGDTQSGESKAAKSGSAEQKSAEAQKTAQRKEALRRAQAQLNAKQKKSDTTGVRSKTSKANPQKTPKQGADQDRPSDKKSGNRLVDLKKGNLKKDNLKKDTPSPDKLVNRTDDTFVPYVSADSDPDTIFSTQVESGLQREAGALSEPDDFLESLVSEGGDWDEAIPSLPVQDIQATLNWDESDLVLDENERNYIRRVIHVDRYENFRQEITRRFKASRHNGLWISLSLLMVFVFWLQYTWINKDRLSMNPDYRIWYERACNYVNCPLPDYMNYDELEATNLVIRLHKREKNAIVVDALLRNNSIFRQPFPNLDLQFRNIKDKLLAHRQFKASEYLKGEMAGLRYIPPKTEVRLSMEIVSPGDEAVSYSLDIVRQ